MVKQVHGKTGSKVMTFERCTKIANNVTSAAVSDHLYSEYTAKIGKLAKTYEICFFSQKELFLIMSRVKKFTNSLNLDE